jgi:hypothetical protein
LRLVLLCVAVLVALMLTIPDSAASGA